MFDFRRITLFCLEKRLSKHKMTMFSKIFFEEHGPFAPLAMPMPKGSYNNDILQCSYCIYCTFKLSAQFLGTDKIIR